MKVLIIEATWKTGRHAVSGSRVGFVHEWHNKIEGAF
jgi:hypothetical protein